MGYQQQNKKAPKHLQAKYLSAYGADDAIRTRDLILTKDVLCRLSYTSIWRPGGGSDP